MYTSLLFAIALLFSACVNLKQESVTPSQKKEIHVIRLNKEVKELDSHDKRLIYKSIKNEISLYSQKGDEDYKNSYYHDAINAYELVNFYEGSNAISNKKIEKMKIQAKVRAKIHYKNAQKYLKSDNKRKALVELNSVMMNNPNYKNTQQLYRNLKDDRALKIYINALENALETKLINNKGSFTELKSIQNSLTNLAKYDYKNSTVQKARKLLREEKSRLLSQAIVIYKKGKLKEAKKNFTKILSIYPSDETATKYMKEIAFKQSKKHTLFLANKALQSNEYLQAIAHAKNVLQLEPKNKETKQIIRTAKNKAKEAVNKYVRDGKMYYNNKNLDQAKECFEKALKIDKTNNTSLIYHKKIQRQLHTIKSLQ
ncbi:MULTISPECIES: tetratricopeptide repeat protein [Sulfurimonas]|uniref:tetratricopeptide repeat protein n=1 Tax=Sulfurimonas TaxID=202746 RepID=UPI00165F0B05|nr:tetratricopeptide repeat protein [Sulfurimonas indica]